MSVAIGISPEKPIDLSAPLSERTNPKVPTMAARADLFPPAHPRRRPAKSSRQKSAAPKSSIDDTISREDQHGVEELFNGFRAGIAELLGGIDAAVKQLRTAALQQKQRCEEVRSSVSDIAGVIGQTNRNISETAMAAADLSASLGRNGSARTPRPARAKGADGGARRSSERKTDLLSIATDLEKAGRTVQELAVRANLLALDVSKKADGAGGEAAGDLTGVAAEVKSLAVHMAKASGRIGSGAGDLSATVSDALAAMGEIEQGSAMAHSRSKRITAAVEKAAVAAERAAASNGGVFSAVHGALRQSSALNRTVDDFVGEVKGLETAPSAGGRTIERLTSFLRSRNLL